MNAILFATRDEATAVCGWIAAALDYPKDGTRVGEGVHVDAPTTAYCAPIERPDGQAFAVVVDATIDALLPSMRAAFPDLNIGDPAPLGAAWTPPFVP